MGPGQTSRIPGHGADEAMTMAIPVSVSEAFASAGRGSESKQARDILPSPGSDLSCRIQARTGSVTASGVSL